MIMLSKDFHMCEAIKYNLWMKSDDEILSRSRLTTADNRAFGVAAPRLWNDLPPDVISVLSVFKKRLKKHFFRQSFCLYFLLFKYAYCVTCP